jgi:hypothetical protein
MNWLAALSAAGVGMAVVGYLAAFGTALGLSFSDEPGLRWLLVPLFALIGVLGTALAAGAA